MNDFLLTLDIIKYGLIVVLLLGITASILSPFIVLNEQSLIADGLAHVSFTALAIGMFFSNEPFYIAVPIVVLSSVLIKWISQYAKLNGDAALGIVSSVGFAVGLIIIRFNNTSIDLESLISGNIWLRQFSDIVIALIVLLISSVFIVFNYRKLLSLTYDFKYAKFMKVKADLLSYILAAITGLFIVIGVRSVGVLLISSLLIFPVITAQLFSKSFKKVFFIGSITTLIVIFIGVIIAHLLNIPAGSTIVITYAFMFLILNLSKKFLRGKKND